MCDIVRHVIERSVGVNTPLFIEKLVRRPPVIQNNNVRWSDFEGENRPVYVGPFFEPIPKLLAHKFNLRFLRAYFLPSPVVGIWRALPNTGTVGGPGGMRGSRLPTLRRRLSKYIVAPKREKESANEEIMSLLC